jgi:hypothetical protein
MLRGSNRPVALAAAGAVGALCGSLWSPQEARAEVAEDKSSGPAVLQGKGNTWYPNTTTKHWHFYKGKMNPHSAKSLKLFKCADTPIADEIAGYLGVNLNKMEGRHCVGSSRVYLWCGGSHLRIFG